MEDGLIVPGGGAQVRLGPFQYIANEHHGIEPGKERRKGVNGHGARPKRLRLDPEAGERGGQVFQQGHLRLRGLQRHRDQHPLALKRPPAQAGQQLLVEDPLVEGVLVDDLHPLLALDDEVGVVELDGPGSGEAVGHGNAGRRGFKGLGFDLGRLLFIA